MNAERVFIAACAILVLLTFASGLSAAGLAHAYAAEPAAASAATEPEKPLIITESWRKKDPAATPVDRGFVRDLQRAFRENDRAWLLDHLDYDNWGRGIYVTMDGRQWQLTSRAQAERVFETRFDSVFPPGLRTAAQRYDVKKIDPFGPGWFQILIEGPPSIQIVMGPRCSNSDCTEWTHRIYEISYSQPSPTAAKPNPGEKVEDYTTEADRAFARELQRAFRENDRAWLLDHLDYDDQFGSGISVNNEDLELEIKTRSEAEKLFEEKFESIFPPALRKAVLEDQLMYLRPEELGMFEIGRRPIWGAVKALSYCFDSDCISWDYRIHSIWYNDPDKNSPPPDDGKTPAERAAALQAERDANDSTTESDRAFARELQRAFRENDRAWLLDHLDYEDAFGFGVYVNAGRDSWEIKTRLQAKQLFDTQFDKVFPPRLREIVLEDELTHLRQGFQDLIWIGYGGPPYGVIAAVERCANQDCTRWRYRINNIDLGSVHRADETGGITSPP